jgi:hypothetical protein
MVKSKLGCWGVAIGGRSRPGSTAPGKPPGICPCAGEATARAHAKLVPSGSAAQKEPDLDGLFRRHGATPYVFTSNRTLDYPRML